MTNLTQVITNELLYVASVIQERAGHAALTGSTPLACLLKGLNKDINWMPNDVDLFVPCHPAVSSCFDGNYNSATWHQKEFAFDSLQRLVQDLKEMDETLYFGTPKMREPGQSKHHNPHYPLSGIRNIFEFEFGVSENEEAHILVQVITVERYPSYEGQSFQECIVNSFDIDIIRGVLQIPREIHFGDFNNLNTLVIWYPNSNIIENVEEMKFNCTIRPTNTLRGIMKRCIKYHERGFVLCTFQQEMHPSDGLNVGESVIVRIPWVLDDSLTATENICFSVTRVYL